MLRIFHSEQECTSTRGQRSKLPKDVYCLLREKRRLVIQDGILYRTRHNDVEELFVTKPFADFSLDISAVIEHSIWCDSDSIGLA